MNNDIEKATGKLFFHCTMILLIHYNTKWWYVIGAWIFITFFGMVYLCCLCYLIPLYFYVEHTRTLN